MQHHDMIKSLPVDDQIPTPNELHMVDTIFDTVKNNSTIVDDLKDMAVIAILFIIISLPPVDTLLAKFIPLIGKSIYMTIFLKAIVLVIVYWLIKNFCLSRAVKDKSQ